MAVLPNIHDRETRGFFEAAAQGRLVYRACEACGHASHPPMAHCAHCGSWDTAWRTAKGTGVLHSWTVVGHQLHPDFPTPYTLVVVELDEAAEVRLVGRIPGEPALAVRQPMQVWFERVADDTVLPQWRAADGAPS
jgi:uncharacterized OB-fold protein